MPRRDYHPQVAYQYPGSIPPSQTFRSLPPSVPPFYGHMAELAATTRDGIEISYHSGERPDVRSRLEAFPPSWRSTLCETRTSASELHKRWWELFGKADVGKGPPSEVPNQTEKGPAHSNPDSLAQGNVD